MFKIEHNVETGEIKQIPLTQEEIADVLARREAAKPKLEALQKEKLEAQEKKEAAITKLAALGLDADDLKALGL